uniref:SDR family oxidoreductase n=1 Tax=Flavobacterium sp. TaxID=239 RepID=UPI004049F574
MNKIFIAGGGGMLGEAFYNVFKDQYELLVTDKDVNAEWISYLDFREFESYKSLVNEFKPDYLFHLGAYTSLEYCEENVEDTFATNTISVEYAVKIANELNIPVLYISTAGIFDGSKNSFDDYDIPNPLGIYARSKFAAERFVIEHAEDYVICRAGWMMGGGVNKDKKFVNKLIKQISEGAKVLNIVNDKDGTPTYTYDFADNVKLLIEKRQFGLFNMVCGGQTSRLEVANEILSCLGLQNQIEINEVSTDFFKNEYYAPRPVNERLVNLKLDLLGLNIMKDWRLALREYIDKEFSHLKR